MSQDSWCTPPEVLNPLGIGPKPIAKPFWKGPVGLDPCSNDRSIVRAKKRYVAGGLHLPWDAPTIYKNEPYSRLRAWMEKTCAELAVRYRGRRKELVGLEPVTPSTEWWRIAMEMDPLLVMTKRIEFLDDQGIQRAGARFDCVLMLWTWRNSREDDFLSAMEPLIRGVTRGRYWATSKPWKV